MAVTHINKRKQRPGEGGGGGGGAKKMENELVLM